VGLAGVVTTTIGTIVGAFILAPDSSDKGEPAPTKTVTFTPTLSTTPQSTQQAQVLVTSPKENQGVPVWCDIEGVVRNLPDDKALVIADREAGRGRLIFEQEVPIDANGQWHARLPMGDDQHPAQSIRQKFEIYAAVMDKVWAAYLADTLKGEDPGISFWWNGGFPPGASVGEPRSVTRTESGKC
jgi:hypothetical protein